MEILQGNLQERGNQIRGLLAEKDTLTKNLKESNIIFKQLQDTLS